MAFPSSPTNGQQATVNGVTYTYDSANGLWNVSTSSSSTAFTVTSTTTSNSTASGALIVSGGAGIAGNVYAQSFQGPIGNAAASTGTFTTVTATTSVTSPSYINTGSGYTGYFTGAIGANTANTGAFTTLTSTGGAINGTVGASTPTTGAFTTVTASNATGPQITLSGGTSNWINIGTTTGVNPPAFTTRSTGSKLVLYENIGAASAGYAIGIENSTMWFSADTTSSGFKWYGGTTSYGTLTTNGLYLTGGLGVGTAAPSTVGQILATNSITAYYSDNRLKDIKGKIPNALDKLELLDGVLYTQNKIAEQFGYKNYDMQVGVIAQQVQAVLPEAVKPAPFDIDADGNSVSGENYLTVQYEKLVPLLIEAIKELRAEVRELRSKI
jgi:hypothetical protein